LINVKCQSAGAQTSYSTVRENLDQCTCQLSIMTLCQIQCGMVEVCVLPSDKQSCEHVGQITISFLNTTACYDYCPVAMNATGQYLLYVC